MAEQLKAKRAELYYDNKLAKNDHKWLIKLKANYTLYLDPDLGTFVSDKPMYSEIDQIIKMNTTLYLYNEDDTISNCKVVGRLFNGKLKIGWETLKDAVEDTSFEIIEFTEKCRDMYLEEINGREIDKENSQNNSR